MSSSIGEQQQLFVRDILGLNKNLAALSYIRQAQHDPGNKLAFEIYVDLMPYLHRLIWHDLIVTVCWIYDRKGHRSIYWYLDKIGKFGSASSLIDEQLARINEVRDQLRRVRKLRNKWVAHRDKETFESSVEFWANSKVTFQDIKDLVDVAVGILMQHYPVTDLTDHGIGMLFYVPHKHPEIENSAKGFLR